MGSHTSSIIAQHHPASPSIISITSITSTTGITGITGIISITSITSITSTTRHHPASPTKVNSVPAFLRARAVMDVAIRCSTSRQGSWISQVRRERC